MVSIILVAMLSVVMLGFYTVCCMIGGVMLGVMLTVAILNAVMLSVDIELFS